jgi:hypothetical protein
MLRYDEYVCRSLTFPPKYELPQDKTGKQIRKLLERLASGRVRATYDNGLDVPRSLFHSKLAVLLLSADPRTRRMVITPYFFFSERELVLSKRELVGPWGGLADLQPRSDDDIVAGAP